jgi:hypothetical protein
MGYSSDDNNNNRLVELAGCALGQVGFMGSAWKFSSYLSVVFTKLFNYFVRNIKNNYIFLIETA